MDNHTTRLARISADTGLSISEAEEYLNNNLIDFDKQIGKYYIWTPDMAAFHEEIYIKPNLTKAEEEWLCR